VAIRRYFCQDESASLCAQAIAATDSEEFQPVLSELRQALRQHVEQIQNMGIEYPFSPAESQCCFQQNGTTARDHKKSRLGVCLRAIPPLGLSSWRSYFTGFQNRVTAAKVGGKTAKNPRLGPLKGRSF